MDERAGEALIVAPSGCERAIGFLAESIFAQ